MNTAWLSGMAYRSVRCFEGVAQGMMASKHVGKLFGCHVASALQDDDGALGVEVGATNG